ncbi:response regulator [Streptomyces sp. NPDC012600]|uniref:Response regulator transcription factor n=2 Tax=Streptomycetaceae TaxID=2062 RepID=A0ABU2W3Z1_9ACTN|nr:response regulator transcription factor [Streptomyces griseus]ARF73553.1 DNA-binding response regulator [Kitasatospora albolonga]MDT0492581.1 response regulator transcription factor [Streptomyces griseus]
MIRVLIVDDEILMRSGLQRILDAEQDIDVPATCDAREAVGMVLRHRPDVVLLDLRMPGLDGLGVLGLLRARPQPPVVAMLTTFSADQDIAAALRAGAAGFLLKDTAPQQLANAVRVLASGGTVLSPTVATNVVDGYLNSRKPHPRLDRLTDREREVLSLLGEGLSNATIGRRLTMSAATAKDHVSSIYTKLGLTNRVQAAVVAHQSSLSSLDTIGQ